MLSTPESTLLTNSNTTTPKISGKKLAKLRKQHLETQSRQIDTNTKSGGFRQAEKYYKTRLWEPDYNKALGHNNLLELDNGTHSINEISIEQFTIPGPPGYQACEDRTEPLRFVTFPERFPGLVYIPGYLSANQQRELILDCFETSLRPPNVNNVDAHWLMPEGSSCGLFELYRTWRSQKPEEGSDEDKKKYVLQPRAIMLPPPPSAGPPPPTKRMTIDLEPITAENYLTARNEKVKEDPMPSDTVKPIHISDLWMKGKLRWVTIGLQYHWTTKTYHFEREPTPMSQLVSSTCTRLVNEIVPWEQICPTMSDPRPSWRDGYRPEAGVINFYQYKDSLTAHVDHSEVSVDSPLVSLSIGNACVFLIGPNRDETPLALRLESGDALIMAGESRRFFHGVPRIIENSLPSWLSQTQEEDVCWSDWFKNGGRINLNVRQVF